MEDSSENKCLKLIINKACEQCASTYSQSINRLSLKGPQEDQII
jgi:hypothetical protein